MNSIQFMAMPRPAKHAEQDILDAAASLVAARGPAAATVAAIGHAIGAPSGSIYHRFRTRDVLLGRLWLMKASYFQNQWMRALDEPKAREAGLQAALSLPRVCREDFQGARIMLLHRREDFLSDQWPRPMKAEAQRLGAQVQEGLSAMTRRLFGRNTASTRMVTTLATLDLPFSSVRRYVAAGEPPPVKLDALIAKAYAVIVDGAVK
jgi:AcrR family transcriptional regulator